MATPLNLYATKVFAEHPLALWALDDRVDYLSLIDSSDQTFTENKDQSLSSWEVVGANVVNAKITSPFINSQGSYLLPKEKFSTVPVNGISGQTGNSNLISFTSSFSLDEEDLNLGLGTIAIGSYFYLFSLPTEEGLAVPVNIAVGFKYDDPETSLTLSKMKNLDLSVTEKWVFVSETFGLPESFNNLKINIEISYVGAEQYSFAVNGITVGQWSEEFNTESLGVMPPSLPQVEGKTIPVTAKGIPSPSYGVSDKVAYYLSDSKNLAARNAGLPLVYGAFNSTELIPNSLGPSLIVPGLGFLNKSGQYRNLTLEFWAKIKTKSTTPKRIVGPISSTDGIYVEGPFVKIKVGKYSGSHYVGEWDRPMLFDFRLTYSSATLVLNGEEVINFNVDAQSISYPEEETQTLSLDWIGFYAYQDVPSIQVDAVAIYAYEVPTIMAKRRWVYGQGVEVPDNVQGLNPSNTVFLDYSFSNYTKNHNYPKIGSWQSGVSDNLRVEDLFISSPEYNKPSLYFNNKTEAQWYQDSRIGEESESLSIKLRPNENWSNTSGYILFPRINFLREDVKAFYGVFKIEDFSAQKRTIFELTNEISGSFIEAYIINNDLKYDFSYLDTSGVRQTETLYTTAELPSDYEFFVGLDIDRVIRHFGNRMALFFGNKQNLKLYVGGKKDFSNVFDGEILRIGFSTALNLQKINTAFNDLGFLIDPFAEYLASDLADAGDSYFGNNTSFWTDFWDGGDILSFPDSYTITNHIASYTLVPKNNLGVFVLDIACSSYWEDYMPLSYFGKYVNRSSGERYFDLDFIQFNFDYPKMNTFFNNRYDTRNSLVRTYVSFQPLQYGANLTREYTVETEYLNRFGVVQPGSDWVNHSTKTIKRYEVLNDSVIYPPAEIELNSIGIFFHVEIESPGIETNPIRIRSLQLASKALNSYPNNIGTRFGADLTPYRQFAVYRDHKTFNPITITKNSSPYLYLSSTSGMRMRGEYTISSARYIEQKINRSSDSFYKVGAIQFAARYDEETFPLTPVEIFEIETKNDLIKFYLIADNLNQKRGQIYAIDAKTGKFKGGIVFYMDGRVVKRLIVKSGAWSVWGLSFPEALDFGGEPGAIRISSPILFDNISHYQVTAEDEIKQNSFRKWSAVAADNTGPIDWDYWANTESLIPDPNNPGDFLKEFTWFDVLFFGEEITFSTLDASDIYKKFAGTSRFIVDSDRILQIENYRYTTYKDVNWSRIVLDAV